jgi:putative membrane protein
MRRTSKFSKTFPAALGLGGLCTVALLGAAPMAWAEAGPKACIALNDDEHTFFRAVALLGRAQVALGKQALAQATRPDVRRLAQQTINAYMRMNAQLNTLAEAKGVSLPNALNDDQLREQHSLAQNSGANFDTRYLALQARGQADLMALFASQAQGHGDRQLTTWAQNAIPQLEAHGRRLAAAQRAAEAAAQMAEDTP